MHVTEAQREVPCDLTSPLEHTSLLKYAAFVISVSRHEVQAIPEFHPGDRMHATLPAGLCAHAAFASDERHSHKYGQIFQSLILTISCGNDAADPERSWPRKREDG